MGFASLYPSYEYQRTTTMNQKNLLEVDWSKIPAPSDDGGATHLVGKTLPPVSLRATDDIRGPLAREVGAPVGAVVFRRAPVGHERDDACVLHHAE